MSKSRAVNVALVALFSAITAVCAQLCILLPSGVALTLQTLAVALCGYALGVKRGMCAVAVYILTGLVGVPVFSGFTSGAAAILSPSGGFIVGFLPLCIACGIAKKYRPVWAVLMGIAGVVICHIFGIIYFAFITKTNLITAVITASLPYIIKDILCVIGAYLIAERIRKII